MRVETKKFPKLDALLSPRERPAQTADQMLAAAQAWHARLTRAG